MFSVGGPFGSLFTTANNVGTASNADSSPAMTATLSHNLVDDGSVTLTIANMSTGLYKVSGTIPSEYAAGDIVSCRVNYFMGGQAIQQVIYNDALITPPPTPATIAAAVWDVLVSTFTTTNSVGYQWKRVFSALRGNYAATYPDPTHVDTTFYDTDGATVVGSSVVNLDGSGRPTSRAVSG
jgi:hypothetical protein